MTDAGFFRGTSADQDNRFANKQKKLLKELNFSPILNTKLNMSKIDVDTLKPWVEEKIKEILEKDDDILSDSIYEHLKEKEPDGKNLLVLITGFVDDSRASKFVEELWTKLIDVQENSNGVSPKLASSPDNGVPKAGAETTDQNNSTTKDGPAAHGGDTGLQRKSRSRSRTHSPTSDARQASKSGSPASNSGSKSHSRSGSKSPHKSGSKSHSRSRSRSASGSRSRSKSKSSRSASRSRSKSRSSSRSGRRSRSRSHSPRHRSGRLRRSRSRSGSLHRRSRSPRGRRGFRGAYRGFGYDRRRGPSGPPRRRPSPPWSRRRFSPRSPPYRRRRTPSISPRRRSRSPYYRRRSPSRSPPPYSHVMNRRSPRPPPPHMMRDGPGDMGFSRHIPPHEMHRSGGLISRSPPRRAFPDQRGFGDSSLIPRHSPGPGLIPIRSHDLPPSSHGHPGPSRAYSPDSSRSSSRKKHKKDKKHKKHKKSKKHRSASPDRRRKHKKHKKTKKHKS